MPLPDDFAVRPIGSRTTQIAQSFEITALRDALKLGLEIHNEYLSHIGHCASQDYARLNEFPIICANLGVTLQHTD